ncbi:MAG: metallophosphoesterase [Clostridiales bacterium]|nr:metallophosphoesterase [Clostridiales bacterium]
MKILLVSDREEPYIWDYFDRERFRDVEMILSCGDLKAEYLSFLVTMINAPLYYVPGNHDTGYVKKPPEGCVSVDDEVVVYKGVRIAGLGGSYKYNCEEFQYTEEQMKKRITRLSSKISRAGGLDILLAHAPAYRLGDGSDLCHTGFKGFIDMMDRYSPGYFIHGHQHLNYNNHTRILHYKDTTIINAFGYYILDTAGLAWPQPPTAPPPRHPQWNQWPPWAPKPGQPPRPIWPPRPPMFHRRPK